MRMLRYIQGISLRKHRKNDDIRKEAGVEAINTMMRRRRLE